VNVYSKRLTAAVLWSLPFLAGFAIDYMVSRWNNQYTLSKTILWILDSGGAWLFVGMLFMGGFLAGHLDSPQDSILGPAAENVKREFIDGLKLPGPITIDRVSAKAFVDEVETTES
jgi:hypothetical protein